jgi:CRP/FNR family cyclic AMP-dependent transcriptional regulator
MEAITSSRKTNSCKKRIFDARLYLASAGVGRKVVEYQRSEKAYSQGEPATNILYIRKGGIKLSVVNEVGKEAVVAILGPNNFCGEGCLAGQQVRMATATAIAPTRLLVIEKQELIHVLHTEREFSDRFVTHILTRNIRVEQDLVDQLFNSSEKRLARALLLLTRHGMQDKRETVLPNVSQETLSEMIGATRSRVNFFMTKFKKLGFIKYDGGLHINPSLLNLVLHE